MSRMQQIKRLVNEWCGDTIELPRVKDLIQGMAPCQELCDLFIEEIKDRRKDLVNNMNRACGGVLVRCPRCHQEWVTDPDSGSERCDCGRVGRPIENES